MAFTDINTEDRLVQKTFAKHLEQRLGWEKIYAWNEETCCTPCDKYRCTAVVLIPIASFNKRD